MEEYRYAIRYWRRALTHFRAHPTLKNLISFKRFRAKNQWVTREAKRTSWKALTSSLPRSTRPDVKWDKLRRMSGKYSRAIIPGLSADGAVLTSQANTANTIASSFSTVCSSDNYDPDFRAIKNNAESISLSFNPRVAEAYDTIFTVDRLLVHQTAAATRPLAPMVSVTKCCRTFPSQASSFCYPYTTVCGWRAWCRMAGNELPSSLF
jgi:hypothetical protein